MGPIEQGMVHRALRTLKTSWEALHYAIWVADAGTRVPCLMMVELLIKSKVNRHRKDC